MEEAGQTVVPVITVVFRKRVERRCRPHRGWRISEDGEQEVCGGISAELSPFQKFFTRRISKLLRTVRKEEETTNLMTRQKRHQANLFREFSANVTRRLTNAFKTKPDGSAFHSKPLELPLRRLKPAETLGPPNGGFSAPRSMVCTTLLNQTSQKTISPFSF